MSRSQQPDGVGGAAAHHEDGERIPALRPQHSNPCHSVAQECRGARQRFLSPAEIARLAEVLDGHPERTTVALIRFLLLTGARFGEAANATWDQFDLDAGTWTKPSSHTKQKREHVDPLSAPALAAPAAAARAQRLEHFLFPGPTGQPLTTIKTLWRSDPASRARGRARPRSAPQLRLGARQRRRLALLIGQLLGHTQAATTPRYSASGRQRAARGRRTRRRGDPASRPPRLSISRSRGAGDGRLGEAAETADEFFAKYEPSTRSRTLRLTSASIKVPCTVCAGLWTEGSKSWVAPDTVLGAWSISSGVAERLDQRELTSDGGRGCRKAFGVTGRKKRNRRGVAWLTSLPPGTGQCGALNTRRENKIPRLWRIRRYFAEIANQRRSLLQTTSEKAYYGFSYKTPGVSSVDF